MNSRQSKYNEQRAWKWELEFPQAPRKGRNPDWSVAQSGEAWPCGSEPGVWTEYKPLGVMRFAFREVT